MATREKVKTVFTTGMISKICKVAPRTVSKWFDSGRLKGYRIPGSNDRRVPRANLIAFLKENNMPIGDLETEELHKILCVGFNEIMRRDLSERLPREKDFIFEYASDPFQAGLLAQAFRPETILIDFVVGRSDAIGIVAVLRRREAFHSTQIIAVVSEDETDAAGLLRLGFDSTAQKPFDAATVAMDIAGLAEARRDN